MPLQTAQDFILVSFRKLGQIRPGYKPSPELLADALNEWVLFFDELGAERNVSYSNPFYEYAVTGPGSLTNGNGYSIGPAFTFSATSANTSKVLTNLQGTQALTIGQKISGTNIPGGTTIAAVLGLTSVQMSKAATGSGNITVTVTPDFIGPRPNSIIRANLVFTNQGPQPVYIPITMLSQEQWASLAIQQVPAIDVATQAWYDPQFPQGVFNVFPPLNSNSIQLYQWGVLQPPTTLAQAYQAPPGYGDMVVYGLAARLYYMVTKEVLVQKVPYQVISAQAKRARDKVRGVNRPIPTLRNDMSHGDLPDGYYDSNVSWTGLPY